MPTDRVFHATPEVRKALEERVAANAATLARGGIPKAPFYLASSVDGQAFSVHAEGERVILTPTGDERREVDLANPQAGTLAVTIPAKVPVVPEPLSSGALPDTALPICPQRLTGAPLDRLNHHVHILACNGNGYRLADSKLRRQNQPHQHPNHRRPERPDLPDSGHAAASGSHLLRP